MRKLISLCLLTCSILLLAGCLGSVPEENTIAVNKRGEITNTIVEDFDKDFYDADELESEIEAELAEYNKNFAADHVSMETFEVEDKVATLQLSFDESKYYTDYTGLTLFVGTLSEAEDEGYDLSGEFVDADGNATDPETAAAGEDVHVLILEEAVNVQVPGTILAVCSGDNVTVTGNREASIAEAKLSYIIYE